MRLTRLDIVVDVFILLTIALMIPIPWLLSFGQVTGCYHQGTLYCTSIAELRDPPSKPTTRESSYQESPKIRIPFR